MFPVSGCAATSSVGINISTSAMPVFFNDGGQTSRLIKRANHQWYGYFGNFRRLKTNNTEVQPALSAFRDGTESIYRHQQNNTDDIEIKAQPS